MCPSSGATHTTCEPPHNLFAGKALVECAERVAELKGQPDKSFGYEDIAEAAFGKLGRVVISSIIYIELFGTCALLFILEGDNLFQLLGTKLLSSPAAYMLAAACVMIPTVWLPDLKALSYLGFMGVSATCTCLAAVVYTYLTGSFPAGAVTDVATWTTLPLVFGIMTFCYSGHGVFPSIQASMKEPKQFPGVRASVLLWVVPKLIQTSVKEPKRFSQGCVHLSFCTGCGGECGL